MLTPSLLAKCMPQAKLATVAVWTEPLNAAMEAFEINTPERAAGFLASIANETGQLSKFEETSYINTPHERVVKVFGRRAPTEAQINQWRTYGRELFDVEFFNWVYDDRRGATLGNDQDGDGYKYRGLGPGQITGKGNCAVLGPKIGVNLVADPEQLLDPAVGARGFACYWRDRGNNQRLDAGQAQEAMRVMNPGLYSFDVHVAHYQRILKVLQTTPKEQPTTAAEAAKQIVTGNTGKALVIAAVPAAIKTADVISTLDDATTAVTASKGLLALYGLPQPWTEIALGVVSILALGYIAWRYGRKLILGEAVST